jgi:hypothetical protein
MPNREQNGRPGAIGSKRECVQPVQGGLWAQCYCAVVADATPRCWFCLENSLIRVACPWQAMNDRYNWPACLSFFWKFWILGNFRAFFWQESVKWTHTPHLNPVKWAFPAGKSGEPVGRSLSLVVAKIWSLRNQPEPATCPKIYSSISVRPGLHLRRAERIQQHIHSTCESPAWRIHRQHKPRWLASLGG